MHIYKNNNNNNYYYYFISLKNLIKSITIYKGDSPFCVHFSKYQFYPLNIIIY